MEINVKIRLFHKILCTLTKKIPNYDSNKKENKKRSLNDFLSEEYRMLILWSERLW